MASKDIRKTLKIGKKNYDVIYRSHITGNLGTFEELSKGKFSELDKGIKPKQVTPRVLRERTSIKKRLIVDSIGLYKERCPRCYSIKITEFANKRESWELGNNFPVSSSKVDFGGNRIPRRRETSKYCESCDSVYVKEKVVVAKY